MGIKAEYKEAQKATSMEVYVRWFKFEVNEVETGLISHSESDQKNVKVPKKHGCYVQEVFPCSKTEK